jgi:mitochondrial fission protein ELM1
MPGDAALQLTITPCHPLHAVMKSLKIWLLCDGKPGHENQSLGLAEAIQRRVACEIYRIPLERAVIWKRLGKALLSAKELPTPDFIFGAGHATHLTLWWLARRTGAKSVVLMRPSLPLGCFDFCIAPYHDFPDGFRNPKVLLTHGALHRVTPGDEPRSGGLILIGGPAQGEAWDEAAMEVVLRHLVSDGAWTLGDSRRTPEGWLSSLGGRWPNVKLMPHTATGPDWVRAQMQSAEQVWVTEDSVSMICEAAGSGARAGILPMPSSKAPERVKRGIDALVKAGHATRYETWKQTHSLPLSETPLLEADRSARWLLDQK